MAIREYRAKMRQMEQEMTEYQDRYVRNEEEMGQIKMDMKTVLQYKNDLEILIEDQTKSIEISSKKLINME